MFQREERTVAAVYEPVNELAKRALSIRERVAEGRVRASKPNIIHTSPHPAASARWLSRPALSRRERVSKVNSFTPS